MKKLLMLLTAMPMLCMAQSNAWEKVNNFNAYVHYPKTKTDKAVLFLPGRGEQGTDKNLLTLYGPGRFMAAGATFPDSLLIICLQPTYYVTATQLNPYIDQVFKQYGVSKICLTGLSAGGLNGDVFYSYSQAYANKIAAVVAVSEEPNTDSKNEDGSRGNQVQLLKNKGALWWGVIGTKDPFYEWNKKVYTKYGTGALWTEIAGAGHDGNVWNKIYDPAYKPATTGKSLYDWFLSVGKPGTVPPVITPPAKKEVLIIQLPVLNIKIVAYSDSTWRQL